MGLLAEYLDVPFINATVSDPAAAALQILDAATLPALGFAITDATFQRLTRTPSSPNCTSSTDADTVTFGQSIAASYGLNAAQTTKLLWRFSPGTEYFNFYVGSYVQQDIITYLQSQVDPTGAHAIDPILLIACGVSSPQKDAASVAALKTCLGI